MKNDLADEKATRHDITRHCEEDVVRRGNLLNGLLRHFVPRNDEYRNGNPPTLTLPANASRVTRLVPRLFPLLLTKVNSSGGREQLNSNHFTHLRKRYAFTLAEVLITLGVIGIVAAMTIPTLVNNYQEKVTITKLKKFYSVMSQCYLSIVQENGLPSQWGITGRTLDNAILVRDKFLPHLKVLKTCDAGTKDCQLNYYTKRGKDSNYSKFIATALLSDGTTLIFMPGGPTTSFDINSELHDWAEVQIDVNGSANPPNILGKDLFLFYVTDKGIIPAGFKGDNYLPFEDHCIGDIGNGCTAWVIQNGNMDYLKCPDELSWDGKHKCSD